MPELALNVCHCGRRVRSVVLIQSWNVEHFDALLLESHHQANSVVQVLTIPDRDELDRYAPIPKLHVDQFSSTIPEGLIARAAGVSFARLPVTSVARTSMHNVCHVHNSRCHTFFGFTSRAAISAGNANVQSNVSQLI